MNKFVDQIFIADYYYIALRIIKYLILIKHGKSIKVNLKSEFLLSLSALHCCTC